MCKQFAIRSFVVLLCLSILMSMHLALPVQAQAPGSTPVPAPTGAPVTAFSDPNIVTFSQLRQTEFELVGPFDSNGFTFSIPADWSLKAGTELDLSLGVSFNSTAVNQLNTVVYGGGTLTVRLNGVTLAVLQLNQVGETQATVPIPPESLVPNTTGRRSQLTLILNADFACLANQNMSVIVHANSHFTLPHDSIPLDTNLANFPLPIFQNSFNADSALLVVPDQPSSSELQAALTVAAGLGNLAGSRLALDLTTVGKLSGEQAAATNLIFVGKAASLPTLAQLQQLPVQDTGGQFQFTGARPDDGFVQMINSPFGAGHAILVISGNTDAATVKAAQAVSTGVLRPNTFSNLSVVQQVETTSLLTARATDQTLTDLGSPGVLFQRRGTNAVSLNFYVPSGYVVTPEAYFELVFGHSALLNYARSGIVVSINGRPIGSVRMSDTTAAQSTNSVRFQIPSSVLVPGTNTLDINSTLIPNDTCAPPNTSALWVNVWPQSVLHLPLTPTTTSAVVNYALTDFPALLAYNPVLSDTAFVLPHNDLDSWRAAVQLASFIGASSRGSLVALSAFYADDVPATKRPDYNFLLVGRPSQMPVMGEMSKNLPVSFSGGSDIGKEGNQQVTYLISPDSPLGYVAMGTSPWSAGKVILAVVGNGSQGVQWAAKALVDSTLNFQVTGNLAVINDRQIIATDTRLANRGLEGIAIATQPPSATAVPVIPGSTVQSQNWILPAMLVLVVVLALLLAIWAIRRGYHNRVRNPNWFTTLLERLHIIRKNE